MSDDPLKEFGLYFVSGNEVPVTQATIPAELARRVIEEFEALKHDNDRLFRVSADLLAELESKWNPPSE